MKTPLVCWQRPGLSHLLLTLRLALLQSVWFALFYGGASYLTSLHSYRVRLHLDLDLAIPFVPASVLGYLSLNVLFALAPFLLPTRRELTGITAAMMVVTVAASVVFLLLPGQDAFQDPAPPEPWTTPVQFARTLAMPNNYFPSLHVTLSHLYAAAYARRQPRAGAALFWAWAGVIALCTLLLHQHYLVDVFAGQLLALAAWYGVYRPWIRGVASDWPAA